jgi:hypothetical protein
MFLYNYNMIFYEYKQSLVSTSNIFYALYLLYVLYCIIMVHAR